MKLDNIPQAGTLQQDDLQALATGAGILGTGGGGDPRIGRLRLATLFEDPSYPDSVDIIPIEEVPDSATVATVGGIGAPTISVEKFGRGDEEKRSLRAIENAADEDVTAVIPGEIGGANSMVPFIVGAQTGLPVIDADGMGRAFPELQMCTFFIYGADPNYAALTDERNNQVVYQDITSPKQLEEFARSITIDMGGRAGDAFPLMSGDHVRNSAIPSTVSLALELGHRVENAQSNTMDPVTEICRTTGGKELFTGKIVDVYRRNREGFAKGTIELEALDGGGGLTIEFQNEFLIAHDDTDTVIASVPDLICIVDKDTAKPITTGNLRYGQRVRVVGIEAPDRLQTETALDVIGPQAFDYENQYTPLQPS